MSRPSQRTTGTDRAVQFERRVTRYAALGEPNRLAIVDHLATTDCSPDELRRLLQIPSNLLAHHLDVLHDAGLVERNRSSGDGRRRYVHLLPAALDDLTPGLSLSDRTVLFVCTANSARSQLAAALWATITGCEAASAGTHPAERVHPGAVAAARRVGIDLSDATPAPLAATRHHHDLSITVCDRAHEELDPGAGWLHWSIPDPVPAGTPKAFDATVTELHHRITALTGAA